MTGSSTRPRSGVAHVLTSLEPGGAELRTVDLIERSAWSFDVIPMVGVEGTLGPRVLATGSNVITFGGARATVTKLAKHFRTAGTRVAHIHLGKASTTSLLAAWIARVPTRIVHFRSDGVTGRSYWLKSVYLWASAQVVRALATRIVGVSPSSLSMGWRADWREDRRCQVIPNGIDVERLRSIATEQPVPGVIRVSNVGRIDPVKNRGRALAVWLKVAARTPAELMFVGDLNQLDAAAVDRANVSLPPGSTIVQRGYSPQPAIEMGASDVVLVTSTLEGLPGVVLESLALGVPVVASDLPGVRWIQESVDGIIALPLSDADDLWADAVIRAAQHDRGAIRSSFDQSEFGIDVAMERFHELWGIPVSPESHAVIDTGGS